MKPIFISGCDRSGTTLLASLLGNHPECIAIPETYFFISALRNNTNIGSTKFQADKFWETVRGHWRFKIWNLPISPDFQEKIIGSKSAVEILEKLVQAYAEYHDEVDKKIKFWVDHTPGNIAHFNTLFNLFPDSKLIHIVRDGRGVANSVLPLDWGPETVESAAKWWHKKITFGLAAELKFKQKVFRIHYETLLENPSSTIEEIVSFLDLRNEFLLSTSGFNKPNYTEKQHSLIGRPISENRATAWETEMESRDIETFEYYTGELLSYLGYEMHYGIKATPPNSSNIIDKIRMYIRIKKKNWARKKRIKNSIKEG